MSFSTISIDVIGLSVRSANALHRIGVHTVSDMFLYDSEQLPQVRNLGQKSVQEILAKIEEYKALEASGYTFAEPKQEAVELDVQAWMDSDSGKEQILQWLQEKQIRIDVLELLSARAYNLLMFNKLEYLYQVAFQTIEVLKTIPRMNDVCAAEILRWSELYLQENVNDIYTSIHNNQAKVLLTVNEMRFMPEYQERILAFVQKNDIPIDSLPLPARPKNRLQGNGYQRFSDIIFLTEKQLLDIPSMGKNSVDQIIEEVQGYFKKYESRIIAFCNGDPSVLVDDIEIRNKVLQCYQENPFSGFSLNEMIEKLTLPSAISVERIKQVIGCLLAERKLEYVDFRCYRIYEKFETFLSVCDALNERSKRILQLRLQGNTLEEIGQEYNVSRERIRQLIKSATRDIRDDYTAITGDCWFDEDYYWYFYENYAFDQREASLWMGISETVWKYLDMMDVKRGKKDLEAALDDHENLEIGLRLKVKNYLNRNKVMIDGVWVEKKRSDLEFIVAKKFCREDLSFTEFAKVFNDFLSEEDIPYDEELYYTDAVIRTRKNRLAECRFLLWKQNEMLRYYDIDSRDYSGLVETLKLDTYENVEYSTLKFIREYPELMKKYDIRDQYELHNLLRKVVPAGSFHDFHCSRTPDIRFGTFDRNAAILDILMDLAPVNAQVLSMRISEEYGYDPQTIIGTYLPPFSLYYHEGTYSIDQKIMPADRADVLHRMLPDDFYYIEEIRKTYSSLYPNADLEEINPYTLKSMGFIVLSRYVIQNHPSLEAYCEYLLTKDDIVDIKSYRQRLTYVQMFSQKLMELKRNLDVVEFEPGQILSFRKLDQAGITKDDIREFCNHVYDCIPNNSYFSAQSLKADGFKSYLYDLGFSDWFYANLLLSDERFSYTNVFGNILLYKGRNDITIQSFLVDRVCSYGWIDTYDLLTELSERYGCVVNEKSDVTYRLKNTQVYHDKILDRLYTNAELYYRDLEEAGGF